MQAAVRLEHAWQQGVHLELLRVDVGRSSRGCSQKVTAEVNPFFLRLFLRSRLQFNRVHRCSVGKRSVRSRLRTSGASSADQVHPTGRALLMSLRHAGHQWCSSAHCGCAGISPSKQKTPATSSTPWGTSLDGNEHHCPGLQKALPWRPSPNIHEAKQCQQHIAEETSLDGSSSSGSQ